MIADYSPSTIVVNDSSISFKEGMLQMSPELAFGKILKKYRTKLGVSQQTLALDCNLDRTFISLLERGKRQPSLGSIILLSERLGIPASKMVKATTDLMNKD